MTTTGKFKINKMTQDIKVTSLDRPFFLGGGWPYYYIKCLTDDFKPKI